MFAFAQINPGSALRSCVVFMPQSQLEFIKGDQSSTGCMSPGRTFSPLSCCDPPTESFNPAPKLFRGKEQKVNFALRCNHNFGIVGITLTAV